MIALVRTLKMSRGLNLFQEYIMVIYQFGHGQTQSVWFIFLYHEHIISMEATNIAEDRNFKKMFA